MKTVLVQPVKNCTDESKLALIVKHLGWKIVSDGVSDVKVWLSDGIHFADGWINNHGLAINKNLVNTAFGIVFEYAVEADPTLANGWIVKKRLGHGVHGETVLSPTSRQRGFCYQKLLTNNFDELWMEEFRIDVYGNRFLNTRKLLEKGKFGFPLSSRRNASFEFNCGLEMFERWETGKLSRFCKLIGMGFGSLDVIRHLDGRLYVIDATTNTAPPTMSWHKNLTLEKYLDVSADYFKTGFGL